MKKSLLRAFLFSLIIFFALNFLFYIIGYSRPGALDLALNPIAAHPTHSIYLLVYPSRYLPWELLGNITVYSSFGLVFLGGFISFIIAAIVAGLMGGGIGKSFGGWVLTIICSIVLFIVIISIDDFNLDFISFTTTLVDGIIITVIAGAVNLLIFGVVVIILAFITGRSN
jgi:hypothetical protein